MNRSYALICNNLVAVSNTIGEPDKHTTTLVGTLLNNLAFYGYTVNNSVLKNLMAMSVVELTDFWHDLEPDLQEITGANRNMENFVVYKNFPKEVLNKSEAEYWISQILMYIGVPNEYFAETPETRAKTFEIKQLKVLAQAPDNALESIYTNLVKLPNKWNDRQLEVMQFVVQEYKVKHLNLDVFGFKLNGIPLINTCLKNESFTYTINDATDLMRLAAAMSDQDPSLREKVMFRKFARSERQVLLEKLENAKNLEADAASRKGPWKLFLSKLRPGDYKYTKVQNVYNKLYNKELKTYNALVEAGLSNADTQVLDLLKTRPGEFLRRLHKMYSVFGTSTVDAFKHVIPKLETIQLLKLNGYMLTINDRKNMTYAPKGNWSKLKVMENKKNPFTEQDLLVLTSVVNTELKVRMEKKFPNGVVLDSRVAQIKLQTNDQKLASYGRGTVFNIPEDMKFLRTASYWKSSEYSDNVWYDNGWNLFDENWKTVGTCCWNHNNYKDAAVFSGDPTSSKDKEGRACQMIDLYLDKLAEQGVRYAVWNVLAYSNVSFDDTDEVLATLQWGVDPQDGELYDPARAQMVFPLKGKNLTKYVAYIDVTERKLVYMDANLPGSVASAGNNASVLEERMPAFIEYLSSLPSVADLFTNVKEGSTKILYSDSDVELAKNEQAYVFKPENANNTFEQIDITEFLM